VVDAPATDSSSSAGRWSGRVRQAVVLALFLVSAGTWFWRASARVDLPVNVPATSTRPFSFALPHGWRSISPSSFGDPGGVRSFTDGGDLQGTILYTFPVTVDSSVPTPTTARMVAAAESLDLTPANGSRPLASVHETEIDGRHAFEESLSWPGGTPALFAVQIAVAPNAYFIVDVTAFTGTLDEDVAKAIVESISFDEVKLRSAILAAS
jgi:hypothetical protein